MYGPLNRHKNQISSHGWQGVNTHVVQYVDSGPASSVCLSDLHLLVQTEGKASETTWINQESLISEQAWTPTEWICFTAAATLLGRGWLTGPGRAALHPTLSSTAEKKHQWGNITPTSNEFQGFHLIRFLSVLFLCYRCYVIWSQCTSELVKSLLHLCLTPWTDLPVPFYTSYNWDNVKHLLLHILFIQPVISLFLNI